MGKFSGILLATDLDGTLLTDDKTISAENIAAINRFMAEGGKFTFCSGRVPTGVLKMLEQIMPNAPIICSNGAAICAPDTLELLWEAFLDEECTEVINMIEEKYDFAGIEVCTPDGVFISRPSRRLCEHLEWEGVSGVHMHHSEIPRPWQKVLFIEEIDELAIVKDTLLNSEYVEKYNFMQSDDYYYEMLPKSASKGLGLIRVAEMLGIAPERTIGIGDNENDLSLIQKAGIGMAVKNAKPENLAAADYITPDNNSSAIAAIINDIETGKIKI